MADHPALAAAIEQGVPVIPIYVLDDAGEAPFMPGGASRWWLHGSLAALDQALRRLGSRLILRGGDVIDCISTLATETNAQAIHLTRGYEPAARRRETELKAACERLGIALKRFPGAALFEPEAIASKSGDPYRVFTPFWKTCLDAPPPGTPLPAPSKIPAPETWPHSDRLADWNLLPSRPDWAGGLRETWQPGEAGAAERLAEFVDDAMSAYAGDRDRPDRKGTSRLSPHLHFGEISARQCWHAARHAADVEHRRARGAGSFVREVGWREFSLHLLFHWPEIVDHPFRPEFANFPWSADRKGNAVHLAAWQRGMTGYPLVDAGMRELWQTGWMHNRVRMITASFLCKHLLIPWQDGARWFWDTLVDADVASNQASWQWVAGSGADAAPYFRIFSPMLQGVKFDPDGAYVRRYVPELAKLPAAHIHAPWQAPAAVLQAAGVTLGRTYPKPIVDHGAARERALAAYRELKAGSQ